MKRLAVILAVVVAILLIASPVLAARLGISPGYVELEVPGDGSATANFEVHFFSGDLKVSLVDIPLEVEPETIYIEPSIEPVDIEVTIYGDDSLGQVYDGYIRFLGMTGGTVAVAVKIKAKVTIVEGQPVTESAQPPGETPSAAPPSPEQTPPSPEKTPPSPEKTPPSPDQTPPTAAPPSPEQPPAPTGAEEFPIIPVAGIGAGTLLLMVIIIMVARRNRYR